MNTIDTIGVDKEKIMRNYALNEANAQQALGRFAWVGRIVSNWRMRKSMRALLLMNDYALRDIGLTPADLNQLLGHSNRVDLRFEVERMRILNAHRPSERSGQRTM
jgi:uncharacterized protein YjiS (DUF1127 family)